MDNITYVKSFTRKNLIKFRETCNTKCVIKSLTNDNSHVTALLIDKDDLDFNGGLALNLAIPKGHLDIAYQLLERNYEIPHTALFTVFRKITIQDTF